MKKTINYLLAGVATAVVLTMAGCSKKDTPLPQIDGYNNSDEVGKANLVAHWTFDSDMKEDISGLTPTKTFGTANLATGQIGKALNLAAGAVVYPSLPKINDPNALNAFTVSLWVNVKGTKGTTNGFTAFFGLCPTTATDVWPDVFAGAETSRHLPNSDTLELKNLLNTHSSGSSNLQDNIAQPGNTGAWFLGNTGWVHFVLTWDGTTHQFYQYGNTLSVGGYTDRGTTGVEVMATPVLPVFGSLISSDLGFTGAGAQPGFNPWATAMIDDVRVFNVALAEKDVTALYNLGLAGR